MWVMISHKGLSPSVMGIRQGCRFLRSVFPLHVFPPLSPFLGPALRHGPYSTRSLEKTVLTLKASICVHACTCVCVCLNVCSLKVVLMVLCFVSFFLVVKLNKRHLVQNFKKLLLGKVILCQASVQGRFTLVINL